MDDWGTEIPTSFRNFASLRLFFSKMVSLGRVFNTFAKFRGYYRGWYYPPEPEGIMRDERGGVIKRKGFFYPKGSLEGFDREKRIPMKTKGLYYPPEAHEGFWHGKGIMFGHYKTWSGKKVNRLWRPNIQEATLYSNILKENFTLKVSIHALKRMDNIGGFDRYILKTHPNAMQSRKGMQIRQYLRNVIKGLEEGRDLEDLKTEFGLKPPVNKHKPVKKEYTNRFYFDNRGRRQQMVFC